MRTSLGVKALPLTLSALLATALPAWAQKLDTSKDRAETLTVTVTGEIDMTGIFRSAEVVEHRWSSVNESVPTIKFGAPHSTFNVIGYIRLRFDVELTKHVTAAVSLRTQRFTGSGTSVETGITGKTNHFGDDPISMNVLVDEASVTVSEFLDSGLKLTLGVVPVKFDLRGKGMAFFFDPVHSSTFGRNATNLPIAVTGVANELQPTGAALVYSRDAFSFDVFALPKINDQGAATFDESAYGAWFFYALETLGKGSRVGGIAVLDHFGFDTSVVTLGIGLDWFGLTDGLELYAEGYFQIGKAGVNPSNGDDLKAKGFAFQLGGEYRLPNNDNNIWFGLNFTYRSGNNNTNPVDPSSDDVKNFLSYSRVTDLSVLENQWSGLGLNSNYLSLKLMAGMAFTTGAVAMKNNLELRAIMAFNRLAGDIVLNDGTTTTSIGHEFDIAARLNVSKQVRFDTGFGILFASDVFQGLGSNDDRYGVVVWLGTDAKF